MTPSLASEAPSMSPSTAMPSGGVTLAPVVPEPETCACQPQKYEFTLDFALTCKDSLTEGPGIEQTACVVEPPDEGDQVPINVTSIEIAEVDQDLQDLNPLTLEGDYENGFTFEYTSAIASGVTVLPKGIKMSITGTNADGIELINTWLILFTNDCSIYPVLTNGTQIGWTTLVRIFTIPWILYYWATNLEMF
jgi:hypothetical protein